MAVSIEALGIVQMSIRDRLDLVDQILNSLPEEVDPDEIPEWHFAEVMKRRNEAELTPGLGTPWREALEGIEAGSCQGDIRGLESSANRFGQPVDGSPSRSPRTY